MATALLVLVDDLPIGPHAHSHAHWFDEFILHLGMQSRRHDIFVVTHQQRQVGEQYRMPDRAAERRVFEIPRVMVIHRKRKRLDVFRLDQQIVGHEFLSDLHRVV